MPLHLVSGQKVRMLNWRLPGRMVRPRRLPGQKPRHSGLHLQRAKHLCCSQQHRFRMAMHLVHHLHRREKPVLHLHHLHRKEKAVHHLRRREKPALIQSMQELLVPEQSWQTDLLLCRLHLQRTDLKLLLAPDQPQQMGLLLSHLLLLQQMDLLQLSLRGYGAAYRTTNSHPQQSPSQEHASLCSPSGNTKTRRVSF